MAVTGITDNTAADVVSPAKTLRAPSRAARIARAVSAMVFRFIGVIVALALAIFVGFLSSRMVVSSGSALTTDRFGPWEYWRSAGRINADPYTRAHILSTGIVPLSVDIAGVFKAETDVDGARLHSSCDYVVTGPSTNGMWWSLSVFDSNGAVIANDANRFAFTKDTIAPNPDGSYVITLGRDARPGNWLPTGGAGRLVLSFTVLDPATGLSPDERARRPQVLPTISSEGCS